MPLGLTVRGGAPRFANLIRSRRPVHIVVFGTSVTYDGHYLQLLVETLHRETGNEAIRLTRVGLWGFTSTFAAFRLESDVLPLNPDLVLIEYAVNDTHMIDDVPYALHAMIGRIRSAHSNCDIGLVYFAPDPHVDQTLAITAHEAVAEHYGLPTINMAAVAADLVKRGKATLTGGEQAITIDGVHQTPAAAELLGVPFTDAMLGLFTGGVVPAPNHAPVASPFERARSASAGTFISDESWSATPPSSDEEPSGAFSNVIASARTNGATLRFSFTGFYLLMWARKTGGILNVVLDGNARRIALPEPAGTGAPWEAVKIPLNEGQHEVEIVASRLPVILADIFIIGEFDYVR